MWFLYVAVSDRARLGISRLVALAQAAALFLLLASPLLVQQARLPEVSDQVAVDRKISEIVHYSPALLSFVTPSRIHPVYGDAFKFAGVYPDRSTWGMRSESTVGVMTWLLAAIALGGVRRGGRAFWAVAAVVLLCLTLGPQLRVSGSLLTDFTLPYRWLYEVLPPLRAGRDPTRIFPLAVLMLSVLAAFGGRALLERCSERRRAPLAGLLVALVVFECLTLWRTNPAPVVPSVYHELSTASDDGPIVDLTYTLSGMLGQTVHGRPIGYVWGIDLRGAPNLDRFVVETILSQPRRLLDLAAAEQAQLLETLRARIRERPVDLLVYPSSPISNRQAKVARLLGASVSSHGGYHVADFSALSAP
jgi:hypothetical protein